MIKRRVDCIEIGAVYDRFFKFIFLFVLGIYLPVNLWSNLNNMTNKQFILMFGVLCVFLVILIKLSKQIQSERTAIIFLISISALILFGWNWIYRPAPVSDYRVIWEGAHQIIDGSFYERTLDKSDYFSFYNFQIPYTYYVSMLLRIHDRLFVLKIAEIMTILLTNVLLYKILRLFCGVSGSFFGATFFACFSYIFIGSGIINNHHIGMMLGALAIYIFLKGNHYSRYIISAMILVVGNLLRPTIVMIFLSIAFVLLIESFCEKKKCWGLLVFVSTFVLFNKLINLLFIKWGLAPYGVKGSDMYFKFLLGLTGSGLTKVPTTDAEHTFLFYDLQYYGFDYEKYKEASQLYLWSLIFEGKLDCSYIIEKVKVFICGIDNQYYFGDVEFNSNHPFFMQCLNYWGVLVYITTIVGTFVRTIRQREVVKNNAYFITMIAFCAYFAVYIFLEVQTRYRYEQYFFLFVVSTPIIYGELSQLDQWIRHKWLAMKKHGEEIKLMYKG